MKKLKSAIAALLSLVLLAGCAGGDSSNGAGPAANDVPARNVDIEYGRYVETEISPPDMLGYVSAIYAEQDVIDIITSDYIYEDLGDDYYQETLYYRYRTTDGGKTWQTVDMEWAKPYASNSDRDKAYLKALEEAEEGEEVPPLVELGYYWAIMPNGDVLNTLSSRNADGMAAGTQLIRAKIDSGEIEYIEIPELEEELLGDGEEGVIISMGTVGHLSGSLFYVTTDKMIQLDANSYMSSEGGFTGVVDFDTGELKYTLDDWNGWGGVPHNDTVMYLQSSMDGTYNAYDIQTGARLDGLKGYDWEQRSKLSPGDSWSNNFMLDSENRLYDLNVYGLYRIGEQDEESEQLMDGIKYTYGTPISSIESVAMLTETSFMVVLSDDDFEEKKIYRYDYDPDAAANSSTVLKIFAMYDSPVVRMAASEFSILNPEITIEYTFIKDRLESNYYNDEDGVLTDDDIMRQLNLDILNGNGPDVVILDDLPLQSYIDQGILTDLSGLVDELGVIDELVNPLYTDKGGLYAIPGQFSIPLLFGEAGYAEQFDSLDALLAAVAQDDPAASQEQEWDFDNMSQEDWQEYWNAMDRPLSPEERPLFNTTQLNDIIYMLYDSSAPAIYNEKTGLDQEGLTRFLQAVKVFSDSYDLEYNEWYTGWNGWSSSNSLVRFKSFWGLDAYSSVKATLGYDLMEHFEALTQLGYANENRRYEWVYNEAEGSYERFEVENPEILTPTIMAMPGLAEGAYYPRVMAGILVNSPEKEAGYEFIRVLMSDSVQKRELAEGLPATWSGLQLRVNKYMEPETRYGGAQEPKIEVDFEGLISQLKQPVYANSYLKDIITEHAAAYCEGSKTLEQAVSDIISESQIYFAERQA